MNRAPYTKTCGYTRCQTTIWCDGDECGELVKQSGVSPNRAVQFAKEEGWTSPEWDEHYCPECSE